MADEFKDFESSTPTLTLEPVIDETPAQEEEHEQ